MTGRHHTSPGIGRRLLSLIYETLLLIAIVLLAGGIAAAIAQTINPENARLYTQLIVFPASAVYFAWHWSRDGQTLPMKTWRLRLVTVNGNRVAMPRALLRAVLATLGYLLLGTTVLWAFVDGDRQFLHDRLAGTRLINTDE